MWLLVAMICNSPAAIDCDMYAYKLKFFDSVEECMYEGQLFMKFLDDNDRGGKAACFDVTEVGKNTKSDPSF